MGAAFDPNLECATVPCIPRRASWSVEDQDCPTATRAHDHGIVAASAKPAVLDRAVPVVAAATALVAAAVAASAEALARSATSEAGAVEVALEVTVVELTSLTTACRVNQAVMLVRSGPTC